MRFMFKFAYNTRFLTIKKRKRKQLSFDKKRNFIKLRNYNIFEVFI